MEMEPDVPGQRVDADSTTTNSMSLQSHGVNELDLQLLIHLVDKYTPDPLMRLFQYSPHQLKQLLEELKMTNSSDSLLEQNVSTRTSSIFSPISEDYNSLFDVGTSRTSSSRSSLVSQPATGIGSRGSYSRQSQSRDIMQHSVTASEPASAKQRGNFLCGFCTEEGIQKTCTRKNDLKRHIEDFHNTNSQWYCRQPECNKVFDWHTVYKTHLKVMHSGSRLSPDEEKVKLCPQTVFACGFENCIKVYEAPSDSEIVSTFKDYVAHVVKHFDEGSNSGEWSYSTRIRNLMRQSGVLTHWQLAPPSETEKNSFIWHPQSSFVLRKLLETRHLNNLNQLLEYAIALGSGSSDVHKFTGLFVIPIKDQCQMPIDGHENKAQHTSPQTPQPDPLQFHIRQDPNLQQFGPPQRNTYPLRKPVRVGRSAPQPSQKASRSSQPLQKPPPPQSSPPPPMCDPGGFYTSSQNQQQPTGFFTESQHQQPLGLMMVPNGVNSQEETMRPFSTISNGVSSPDVEMGDVPVLTPNFMSQTNFANPFGVDFSGFTMDSSIPGNNQLQQQTQFMFGPRHSL